MNAQVVNQASAVSTNTLVMAASEQRMKIHETLAEARSQMHQKLDVRRQVRNNLVPASAVAAGFSLVLGYGFAGIFRR
ncbi:MAG: hypothetical protein AB7O65_10150 [Candidatus Korobacteraceae bacterium]